MKIQEGGTDGDVVGSTVHSNRACGWSPSRKADEVTTREQVKRAIRQRRAVEDVLDERKRQDEQWGVQNHHPAYWLAIIGKQVGQFGSAILNREWAVDSLKETVQRQMREEAVQMAAVALCIIECIDAGEMPDGLTTAKPADPRQLAKALGRGDEQIDYEKGPEF